MKPEPENLIRHGEDAVSHPYSLTGAASGAAKSRCSGEEKTLVCEWMFEYREG